jgi:hypothetical protein
VITEWMRTTAPQVQSPNLISGPGSATPRPIRAKPSSDARHCAKRGPAVEMSNRAELPLPAYVSRGFTIGSVRRSDRYDGGTLRAVRVDEASRLESTVTNRARSSRRTATSSARGFSKRTKPSPASPYSPPLLHGSRGNGGSLIRTTSCGGRIRLLKVSLVPHALLDNRQYDILGSSEG